jgi:hypothetical protein
VEVPHEPHQARQGSEVCGTPGTQGKSRVVPEARHRLLCEEASRAEESEKKELGNTVQLPGAQGQQALSVLLHRAVADDLDDQVGGSFEPGEAPQPFAPGDGRQADPPLREESRSTTRTSGSTESAAKRDPSRVLSVKTCPCPPSAIRIWSREPIAIFGAAWVKRSSGLLSTSALPPR